jgi:hypothetical protein
MNELDVFANDVGQWDATVEVRVPGQPVQTSEGVSERRLIAGGKWLVIDFRNQSTGFEGHGIQGWDPARGEYVSVWVDNQRSTLTVGHGEWDHERRTMTFRYELARPDGKAMRWREVIETTDADTQVFRSYMPAADGTEHELMTVTYRRRR